MGAGHFFLVLTGDSLAKALVHVDELQVLDKVLCAYKSRIKIRFFVMFSCIMCFVSLDFQLDTFYPDKSIEKSTEVE